MIPSAFQANTKAASYQADQAFAAFLLDKGHGDLACYEAIKLYKKCLPLANAIDLRAGGGCDITLCLQDIDTENYIYNHPALTLLENPSADVTKREFFTQVASYWDITGTCFIAASAMSPTKPPVELFTIPPFQLTLLPSIAPGTAGHVGTMTVQNSFTAADVYTLREKNRRFRYYSQDGNRELWRIKDFNPMSDGNNLWGMAKMQVMWLEIQQYIEGNLTNHSMLSQGIRPSGAFINTRETPLTEDQWERLKQTAKDYSGAKGTGRAFFADGVDFKQSLITHHDMQYRDLQNDMFARISSRFRIPQPFVSNVGLSYNNLQTADYQLYTQSIIPMMTRICEEFTAFLLPRYPGSERLKFTFNPADIPALRLRTTEEAKVLRYIAVATDDEIRATLGLEKIAGGDVVWKPTILVPTHDGVPDAPVVPATSSASQAAP